MVHAFVPKETRPGETRVAATPETVKKMIAAGLSVSIEAGAGNGASLADAAFVDAGATVAADAAAARAAADLVLRVTAPTAADAAAYRAGAIVIGLLAPHEHADAVRTLRDGKVSALAMELVPRISRAQSMDALSSQASIAGYKAVLLAAHRLGKYFPLLMTAAGTIKPAKVVVMGAGVAGLQAVATAKRLGAQVEVSDIRPVVKEQVESLGGKFIPLPETEELGEGAGGYAKQMTEDFLMRQREIVTRHVAAADVVVCTALVPGRKAPTLITAEMVAGMRQGAIIVDLAVGQGGNCVLSREGEEVLSDNGVLVLGPSNLPAETAEDASQLYARNVWALVELLVAREDDAGDAALHLDLDDEIIDGALLTHDGAVRHAPTRDQLEGESA
ncbi:MAG: Re/Si-specific NAD(P)(+) transhydrogenase subunit alpha [Acidobacteriota bacterium]